MKFPGVCVCYTKFKSNASQENFLVCTDKVIGKLFLLNISYMAETGHDNSKQP